MNQNIFPSMEFIKSSKFLVAADYATIKKVILTRASNRLKYRSGFGLDSAKFIFSGSAPGQVFRRLILKVQFRLKLKIL